MRRIATVALLLALACSSAAPPRHMIEGSVLTTDGAPLPGVTITITGNGRTIVTSTDADGKYTVGGLAPGEYHVVSELAGFSAIRQKAQVTAQRGATLATRMQIPSLSQTSTTTFAIDVDRASYRRPPRCGSRR